MKSTAPHLRNCHRIRSTIRFALICLICVCVGHENGAEAQSSRPTLVTKDPVMMRHANGNFDVKTVALAPDDATTGIAISRYALDKQFHGDLEAVSRGEMLGAGDPSKGAAGYVALEVVTGTLDGRKGSFALQHNGTMDHGKFEISVVMVPGSGTGELAGIAGAMTITVAAGKHSYQLEYSLPATP